MLPKSIPAVNLPTQIISQVNKRVIFIYIVQNHDISQLKTLFMWNWSRSKNLQRTSKCKQFPHEPEPGNSGDQKLSFNRQKLGKRA